MPFKVIKENIVTSNNEQASKVRELLRQHDILMLNLISSPGAGKTTLLEKTATILQQRRIRAAVLTGDCFTSRDAERLVRVGLSVVQINTGNACHIESQLVLKSLGELNLGEFDCVIVENVGNLVCPAEFDIGEASKVALLSVTEGHDKPIKYPLLFKECAIVLINKMDLLKQTDFDIDECKRFITQINPDIPIDTLSCRTGEGIDDFINWIEEQILNTRREVV